MTALREIKFLKELRHPNVVELMDVFPHKKNLLLVYPYMDTDLEHVIKDPGLQLRQGDVKGYLQQMLEGLKACHQHWILHRDVKPNNMLIGRDGVLKLADFGAGRAYGSPNDAHFTTQVFARWYRAPELLFGSRVYGPGVDIWGLGCTFAELMLRKPYLPADSDIEQLSVIFEALGTPTEEQWKGMRALPGYIKYDYKPRPSRDSLRQLFKNCPDDAIDLLLCMLAFDPSQRISAAEALKHPYFSSEPKPTPLAELPLPKKSFGGAMPAPPPNGQPAGNGHGNGRAAAADGAARFAKRLKLQLDDGEEVRRGSFPPAKAAQPLDSATAPRPADAAKVQPPDSMAPPSVTVEQRPQMDSVDLAYLKNQKSKFDLMLEDAAD